MNKQIYIQPNQTIWDIALQEYGSVDFVYSILKANPTLTIDSEITPGELLIIPSVLGVKQKIVNYYKSIGHIPASGSLNVPVVDNYIGLLDANLGASAGYSLRGLVKDYAGPCVKIRRPSDNATLDIGFINHELDVVSLLNFVGNGDGFVEIWYSQIGTINLTQSNLNRQPKLVINGVVNTVGGRHALRFKAAYLQTSQVFTSDIKFQYEIHQIEGAPIIYHSVSMYSPTFTTASNFIQLYSVSNNYVLNFNNNALDCSPAGGNGAVGQLNAVYYQKTPSDVKLFIDNNLVASKLGVQNIENRFIVGGWNSRYANVSIPEILIYEVDNSIDKDQIYSNQNNYYNF